MLLFAKDIPLIELLVPLGYVFLASIFILSVFFFDKLLALLRCLFVSIPARLILLIRLKLIGGRVKFLRSPLASAVGKHLRPDLTLSRGDKTVIVTILPPNGKRASLSVSDHGSVVLTKAIKKSGTSHSTFIRGDIPTKSYTESRTVAVYSIDPINEDSRATTHVLLVHPLPREAYGVTQMGKEPLTDGLELKNGYTVYTPSGLRELLKAEGGK